MRSFIVGDLKAVMNSNDAATLKTLTAPKGVVANYLNAMDLWAASYSDSSPSPKTVAMREDVEKLRKCSEELLSIAKLVSGEEVKKTGGVFGLGAKQEAAPSATEAKELIRAVQERAIAAYNDYAQVNNEGHPFEVDELMEI